MKPSDTHIVLTNLLKLPLTNGQILAMVSEFVALSKAVFSERAVFEAAMMSAPKIQPAPHLDHDDPSYARIKAEIDYVNNGRVHLRSSTSDDFSRYGPSFFGDYRAFPQTGPEALIGTHLNGFYPHLCVTARSPQGDAKACIDFNRLHQSILVRDVNMAGYGSVVEGMRRKHPLMRKRRDEWGNAEIIPLIASAMPA